MFTLTLLIETPAAEAHKTCGHIRWSDGQRVQISADHMSCRAAKRIQKYWWRNGPGVHWHKKDTDWWTLRRYPGWRCFQGAGAGGCSKGKKVAGYSTFY
jgi:hypothetical protein